MKFERGIEEMSDAELVSYSEKMIILARESLEELYNKYGLENGSLNYRGCKKYLQIDLKNYHREFVDITITYIQPIELEVSKRIRGNDKYYSELHDSFYKFNLKRLDYFENNMKNAFIGRLTPRQSNPMWASKISEIETYFNQPDYKKSIERNIKINQILDLDER